MILKSGFYRKQVYSSVAGSAVALCRRILRIRSLAGAPARPQKKFEISTLSHKTRQGWGTAGSWGFRWALLLIGSGLVASAGAQQKDAAKPVVVQPGAPGAPTKTLPASTRGTLPPASAADVEFMQGMIMHHAQAIEMTAMIPTHTENKDLRSLGARISSSQADEIKFMKRWLAARGEPISPPMPEMPGMDMSGMDMSSHPMALMPGMLTPKQMEALKKAKGAEF